MESLKNQIYDLRVVNVEHQSSFEAAPSAPLRSPTAAELSSSENDIFTDYHHLRNKVDEALRETVDRLERMRKH